MYWKLSTVDCERVEEGAAEGRYVLHRHHDADGPHLDLRIEEAGFLLGWRVDGMTLDGEQYASEKGPHPVSWLEHDGEAVREDAGTYAWLERSDNGGRLALRGRDGVRVLEVSREGGLPARMVRAIREALDGSGAAVSDAAGLIADGVVARRQAIARFCGLGRELDGSAFEEAVWRRTLSGLSLEELHGHLRAYEVRFDAKHPPAPVSRPEPLGEGEREERAEAAWEIVRGV